MRREVGDLYRQLQGQLTDSDLIAWTGSERGSALLLRFLSGRAGIEEWIQFKAILTEELLQKSRKTLIEVGHSDMELIPTPFPLESGLRHGLPPRGSSQQRHQGQTLHHALAHDAALLRR